MCFAAESNITPYPLFSLLSHTQADLNKESTKDNLGVNIKKTELLNH